jgi:type I restriction-modification system DNA methylase subunit
MTTAVERKSPTRYNVVSEEKAGGATYTPKKLADFVAEQILRSANVTGRSRTIKVLDPAVGDWELLLSLLERLAALGVEGVQVYGFETDAKAVALARSRIRERLPLASIHLEHGDLLNFVLEEAGLPDRGTLFENRTMPRYDLIIANPPYVRTQIMGSEQAQLIASQFELSGRVDLYHAFVVGIAHVLQPGCHGPA